MAKPVVLIVIDGLTLAVITHDEHVAGRAGRRVGIIDGVLREMTAPMNEPVAATAGRRVQP